jgi:Tat protein secretion system quality control protein TatD with DNase activity
MTRPSFIREVLYAIAEIKQLKVEEAALQVTINFESFFDIKLS